jgi:ATP/maltotriose-dependent transcriptional regulator MalT
LLSLWETFKKFLNEKLFISSNTIKTHLKNIFLKLEVDSRSAAVAKAKAKEMELV